MDCLIDTNLFLDVFLKREGLYIDSKEILALCRDNKIHGYISSSSLTYIFYILNKYLKDKDRTYLYLGYILDLVSIIPVDGKDIKSAFDLKAKDFEDALVATCAKRQGINTIITRNTKDFADFDVKSVKPEDFLEKF